MKNPVVVRGRALVLVLMASLVVASFAPAGRAAESALPNWYVTKISATVPTDFTSVESYEIVRDSDGPMVIGAGLAWRSGTDGTDGPDRTDQSDIRIYSLDDDEWSVGTSRDAGAINAILLPRTDLLCGSESMLCRLEWNLQGTSTTYRGHVEPGAPLVRLLFVTNGHFAKEPIEVAPSPGLQVETRSGTGADVMPLTDTRNSGIAGSAVGTGGGTVHREGIARDGVVGAFASCTCRTEWRSPEKRSDTPMFSGPAGKWALSLTGVFVSLPLFGAYQPVVAAWAPIGADWQYFINPPNPLPVQ